MAPILPRLSDDPRGLAAVVRAARDAGACFVWISPLDLRAGTREHFLQDLAREWPELLPAYGPGASSDRARTARPRSLIRSPTASIKECPVSCRATSP